MFNIQLGNYKEFHERHQYFIEDNNPNQNESVQVPPIKISLCSPEIQENIEEVTQVMNKLNNYNESKLATMIIIITFANLFSCSGILLFDLFITIIDLLFKTKFKDTQKISFMKNVAVLNFILIECLMLCSRLINRFNFKKCLDPLIVQAEIDIFENQLIYTAIAVFIFQLYGTLFFLVQQRNQFTNWFILWIAVNIVIVHSFILNELFDNSKPYLYVVLTFRQIDLGWVIVKLQSDFTTTQQRKYVQLGFK
ncbi:hypothetical protein pb186bvf_003479 [Paramecium bursaria]